MKQRTTVLQDICSLQGQACVADISTEPEHCLKPCEGIYASVVKHETKSTGDHNFLSLLDDYKKYKNLFDDDVNFPNDIKGWQTIEVRDEVGDTILADSSSPMS